MRKLNEEKVPAETYFLVRKRDNKIVGMINIRLQLHEKLKEFGGNIGYSIRPTERRKGYNKINQSKTQSSNEKFQNRFRNKKRNTFISSSEKCG